MFCEECFSFADNDELGIHDQGKFWHHKCRVIKIKRDTYLRVDAMSRDELMKHLEILIALGARDAAH